MLKKNKYIDLPCVKLENIPPYVERDENTFSTSVTFRPRCDIFHPGNGRRNTNLIRHGYSADVVFQNCNELKKKNYWLKILSSSSLIGCLTILYSVRPSPSDQSEVFIFYYVKSTVLKKFIIFFFF